MKSKGLRLHRRLRERKEHTTCFDSIGVAVGSKQIVARAEECLAHAHHTRERTVAQVNGGGKAEAEAEGAESADAVGKGAEDAANGDGTSEQDSGTTEHAQQPWTPAEASAAWAEHVLSGCATIDANDCNSKWWTGSRLLVDTDGDFGFSHRMARFWQELGWMPEQSAVLVGHSMFFREMMRGYLRPVSPASRLRLPLPR